jgi:hypothetical protein
VGKFQEGLYEDLKLSVRHSAWLNAVPEKPPHDKSKAPQMSRLKRLQQGNPDYEPDMPPVQPQVEYLLGYLFEMGPTLHGDMGPKLLTHEEIQAWQRNIGIKLTPWQVRWMRNLSAEYLGELNRAHKHDCPAPWGDVHVALRAHDTKQAIRGLAEL